jgi:hypothetical protein
MQIALLNRSSRATDHQIATIALAIQTQCARDFGPAYGFDATRVTFFPGHAAPAGVSNITLVDAPDQADDLGWHTDEDGAFFGYVFANPVLDNGGSVFGDPTHPSAPCLASVFSHEVLELRADRTCNAWYDLGATRTAGGVAFDEIAGEVCDPVEGDGYIVRVGTQAVVVSNFVLQTYFDPNVPAGTKRDFMRKLADGAWLDAGGYAVVRADRAAPQQIFGEKVPGWKKDIKRAKGRAALLAAA